MRRGIEWLIFLMALPVLLILPNCGGGGGDGGNCANVEGTWAGSVSDQRFGNGNISLSFNQNGCSLTGSGTSCFNAGCSSGTLVGSLNGNSLSARITPTDPQFCPVNATGTVFGNEIPGSYVADTSCTSDSGSFDIFRQ
jgi:hypothetical protein